VSHFRNDCHSLLLAILGPSLSELGGHFFRGAKSAIPIKTPMIHHIGQTPVNAAAGDAQIRYRYDASPPADRQTMAPAASARSPGRLSPVTALSVASRSNSSEIEVDNGS
jgi:hypothetical protein